MQSGGDEPTPPRTIAGLKPSLDGFGRWNHLLSAVVLCLLSVGPAHARWVRARIDDSLPKDLKARAGDLLRVVRPNDTDAALAATKVADADKWREFNVLIMRVETDCRFGRCMTIIARITEFALIPELTLLVGNQFIVTDEAERLRNGTETWLPLLFDGGRDTAVTATRRDGTWVVGAQSCAQCFPAGPTPPKPSPVSRPEQPQPRETFEDFQRALDKARDPQR